MPALVEPRAGERRVASAPAMRADPVDHVGTHDSVYARGDEAGYVRAMIEAGHDFYRWVLATHSDALVRDLTAAGAHVRLGRPTPRGPWHVPHRMLRVAWR